MNAPKGSMPIGIQHHADSDRAEGVPASGCNLASIAVRTDQMCSLEQTVTGPVLGRALDSWSAP